MFLAARASLLLGPSADRLRRCVCVHIYIGIPVYPCIYKCIAICMLSLHFNFLVKGNSSEAATFHLMFWAVKACICFQRGPVYICICRSELKQF